MVGFYVLFVFCGFFFKGHIEVNGTIDFSVLADVNGQEKAERQWPGNVMPLCLLLLFLSD